MILATMFSMIRIIWRRLGLLMGFYHFIVRNVNQFELRQRGPVNQKSTIDDLISLLYIEPKWTSDHIFPSSD